MRTVFFNLYEIVYLNCGVLNAFFELQIEQGRAHFVIDFRYCEGMDSTFLGIMASAAMKVKESPSGGSFCLLGLSGRNLEVVCNLGLQCIMEIDFGSEGSNGGNGHSAKASPILGETAGVEVILRAHEALSEVNANNRERFEMCK